MPLTLVVATGSAVPAPMFYTDPAFPPQPLPPAAVRLLLVLLSAAVAPDDTQHTPVTDAAAAAAAVGAPGDAVAPAAAVAAADRPTVHETPAAAVTQARGGSGSSSVVLLEHGHAGSHAAQVAMNASAVRVAASITGQVQALLPPGFKVRVQVQYTSSANILWCVLGGVVVSVVSVKLWGKQLCVHGFFGHSTTMPNNSLSAVLCLHATLPPSLGCLRVNDVAHSTSKHPLKTAHQTQPPTTHGTHRCSPTPHTAFTSHCSISVTQ